MRASCQAGPHREGTARVKVPASWWLPPGIPDVKQTNQKDHGFKAFLGNLARPRLIKECRLVVECLPSIPEAMGSISSTARKRGRRKDSVPILRVSKRCHDNPSSTSIAISVRQTLDPSAEDFSRGASLPCLHGKPNSSRAEIPANSGELGLLKSQTPRENIRFIFQLKI